MTVSLRFVVYTPQCCLSDQAVRSARVPTESGQLGLRPGLEPLLTVVEPGLIVLRAADGTQSYVASSGGPLRTSGSRCELYTAFAVAGRRGDELLSALDQALKEPDGELASRRRIEQLEQQILREASGDHVRRGRPIDG